MSTSYAQREGFKHDHDHEVIKRQRNLSFYQNFCHSSWMDPCSTGEAVIHSQYSIPKLAGLPNLPAPRERTTNQETKCMFGPGSALKIKHEAAEYKV